MNCVNCVYFKPIENKADGYCMYEPPQVFNYTRFENDENFLVLKTRRPLTESRDTCSKHKAKPPVVTYDDDAKPW